MFMMAVALYASRVILQTLGVEDFGIYNAVGGFVAIFAVVSRSLSSAASRFLNFEMGTGNEERLKKVFSVILIIHIFLAVLVAILLESFGLWFVNNQLVIHENRLAAANWVFQFSVISFGASLITVPYRAAVIAHEHMNIFAYIGVSFEIAKLIVCFLLLASPIDKLVFYAFLLFSIHIVICFVYWIYCRFHFPESLFVPVFDRGLYKEIFSFASWNMIGTSSVILKDQGGTLLLNLFFGPIVNAARAIAIQVQNALLGFVESFMTAINPQITKSYASGDRDYMMSLIFRGTRFSYYLLLIMCLPILFNTEYILGIWLKSIPDYTVQLVQLTLILLMTETISRPLITAQLATGNIKKYQIIVGGLQMLNVPFSYLSLVIGGSPESILYVAIVLSIIMLISRIHLLKSMIGLEPFKYLKVVIFNLLTVTLSALSVPFLLFYINEKSLLSFLFSIVICVLSSIISSLFIGCSKKERFFIFSNLTKIKERLL